MQLATSDMIGKIDEYSQNQLGISIKKLMEKSGEAVADSVISRVPFGGSVAILAGKGNNGGDGYAAAVKLMDKYSVTVYDVFSSGQKSAEGKYFLNLYLERGGSIVDFEPTEEILSAIKNSDCIVDAIFGTGFHGDMPEKLRPLAIAIRESVGAQKIAVDVPLGINADNGTIGEFAISVGATVELSYIKPGIVSYPARSYVGDIVYADLGLPKEKINAAFSFKYHAIDDAWIRDNLPKRSQNSHKGTFGKLLAIIGSKKYRGAAHLALEAALRGGVGLVTFVGESELASELSMKFPEAIYKTTPAIEDMGEEDIAKIVELSRSHSATLIGSGSDNTSGLLSLTLALLASEGGPLVIDADAVNALSTIGEDGVRAIKNSKRRVILTPHPLEFSRLTRMEVALVQLHRIEAAEKFSKENGCTVVLKGAGTVIGNGEDVYINLTGSSALAKAGSGDVLAGLIAALVAQGSTTDEKAAALGVYYHAVAGDSLSKEFSSYGVTPSDLPKEIARQMAKSESI